MVLFNYGIREITAKIVYYGPGLCGKTTNLQHIHGKMNPTTRGKLLSLATETDRTLFFDFLPVSLGKIRGFNVRFQLYTVPGQVYYNATRRLVLKGADAVVFVADSQRAMREKNLESLENLRENLQVNGLDFDSLPLVIQYNKQDLPNIMDMEEMDREVNLRRVPSHPSIAVTGEGVLETFKLITRELMQSLREKHAIEDPADPEPVTETLPSPPATPVAAPPGPSNVRAVSAGDVASSVTLFQDPTPVQEEGGATADLAAAVRQMQHQIQNIEEQLRTLLTRDDVMHELLEEIKEKLPSGGDGARPALVDEEEPIFLEEEKPRKKGFFWNR